MADLNRKPLLDRAAALLAGPILLGRRALGLVLLPERSDVPGDSPGAATPRLAIQPPEHAIKRRG